MAKKKKDPLAAAARRVVKDTANKAVKQTAKPNVKKQQPKQSSRQNVRQSAKDVSNIARNTMRNAGESTKKATVGTARALPKKKAKPFKASDLSGNTGRGVTKQARKQTKSAYTGASQRKAYAKQKEKDIRAGKFNVPNRLSQADEMMLSQEGKNAVNYYKNEWEKAKARGDKAGMQKAHEEAEKIRLTNPATVKTTTYEGPTQSQVTMAALQQYAQAMQAGDEEGMRNAKNLAAYAMLNVPKDNREQSYMTGAYSGGTWGDRALEASESDILKNQKKNLLKSEGAAFASAVPEAAGGYIETVMNAPDMNGGSSQLVVKDQNVDKRKASQFDLRGQSRYTEEDARAKADHYQAQAEYLKQIAYATTPLPGVVGKFAVDATAAAGGMGIDLAANTIVPGSGLISMGARTWGSSVQQAKDYQKVNGTDKDPYADAKAYLYGTAIAGTEVLSEKMFGGPWSKIYGRGLADAAVKGATKPTIGKTILKGMLEEGSEELAADLVQWKMPAIYGGDVETLPEMLKGAAYDFTLGAALGGLGGAVTAPGQVRAEKVQNLRKRMESAGYEKDDIDTAFQRMTVGDMEALTDSPDSTLKAWVDTVIGRADNSSQNENQSLSEASEASGEQGSEQTFEGEQGAVAEGKTWKALRKRLRESGVNDERMLRLIRSRMSAEEMEEAANLRKNDFLEWRDRVTSPDYQPAPREEEPTESITAEELNVEEEDELSTISPAQINKLADKLREFGVDSRAVARAISDDAVLEQLVNMDAEELRTWAEEQKAPAQREALQEQEAALKEQAMAEQAEAQTPVSESAPATSIDRAARAYGRKGAETLVAMYDPGKPSDIYMREMARAYNAGFTGNARPVLNRVLTKEQSQAMYIAGRLDSMTSLQARNVARQNAVSFDNQSAGIDLEDKTLAKMIEAAKKYEGTALRFNRKDAQHLDKLLRSLGKKGYFVESIDDLNDSTKKNIANGSYGDGIVKLSLLSDRPITFVIGHEVTHAMAEMSPKEYRQLEKYVAGTDNFETRVNDLIKLYEAHGMTLSWETAIEEVVADYVGQMVNELDLLEQFARRADRNLLQKFLDALRSVANKLTGKDRADVNQAIRLVENLLDASVKQNRRMQKRGQITTDVLNGKAVVNSETGQLYSMRSMKYDLDEGAMFNDLVRMEIMTQEQADELKENITGLMEYMVPYAAIIDVNEEWTKGNRPYAPIKPNSDPLYKVSLDFTTLCRKRLLTQSIIERIQMEEKKATSSDRQLKIRSLLQDYRELDNAVQVACGMCYVEAARLKQPKVINEFLKNPRPTITTYFAKKDSGFEARLKEMGAEWKEEHGYARDAKKSDMSNKDQNAFNNFNLQHRREYQLSSEQKALADKIKAMPPETFLSEANLTKLLIEEPIAYDIFISKVRASTRSKALQGPVPYYYGDSTGAISDRAISKMNAENGLRFQSWSDWQVQHLLDMMTAVIDLSVRGVKMHGYTKFPEEVRIFGNTGMQFNLSGVLGTVDPIINEDGTYSEENFDTVEGVDIKEAKKVRDEFPDTAGIQCIGVSDEQILALLNTDWIDYVIPYHSSGLNKALRKIAGIEKWEDYTKVQEAHPIDKKAEPGPNDDAENWHKEPAFSEFMVWEGENGLDCMRKSAERYVQLCKERGMVPKFNDLRQADHPGAENYWKLLIDRKMINQKTGGLIIQQAVRPDFNFDAMKTAIEREVSNYDPTRENRVYKYVIENGSKKGIRFSKEMKERAASIGNTLVENVVSEPEESTGTKYSIKRTKRQEKRDNGEKLTESQFYGLYSAHIIAGGRQADDPVTERTVEGIKENGFQGDGGPFGANVLPTLSSSTVKGYTVEELKAQGKGESTIRDLRENPGAYGATWIGDRLYYNLNDTMRRYGARKGQTVLLVPESDVDKNDKIRTGFKPFDYEIVTVERDFQPYYELYSKAYDKYQEQNVKYSLRGSREFNDTVVLEESTVDTYLQDYAAPSSPNYAQAYIVHMSPRQFLDLTTSITGRAAIERDATDLDLDQLANATRFQPFQLRINHETGEVYGHEGRHRMEALRRNNVYAVPVLLFDSSNKSSKEFMDSLTLTGQDFGSTRSLAMTTVHGVLPLSYANRDEIIKRFATQPTDERIAENYGKETVRYSLKQRDAAYLQAVRDGDMLTAQMLVDEASEAAGYTVEVYHGTRRFGFTEIDIGKSDDKISFFVTEDLATASTYSGTEERVIDQAFAEYYADDENGKRNIPGTYRLYMKPGNFLEVDARGNMWNNLSYRGLKTTREIAKYAFDNGYDGVHFLNVIDHAKYADVDPDPSDVYALFHPEQQLKSADPITIDNEGNIIPLSERFNPDNPDIRWSISGGLTYDEYLAKYGSIKPGERRARNIAVPAQTSDNTKVHMGVRTIMEAGRTPEEILPRLKEMIASGEFSYEVFGNREAVESAQAAVEEKGFAVVYGEWSEEVNKGIVSASNVAMGWVLYDTAIHNKDWKTVARIAYQMAKVGNTLGQGLQAMRILKLFSPEMQLAVMDGPKPEHVQKKIDARKKRPLKEGEEDFRDLFDEEDDDYDVFMGGEKEQKKKPRKKPQRKPAQEQDETGTDEDIDTDITQEDVYDTALFQAKQAKATFAEKWNAWRYLAMLFNPRTHIRNVFGNALFAPVVMSKNATATVAEIAVYYTVGRRHGMQRTKGFYLNPKLFSYAWKDYYEMKPVIMSEKFEGQDANDEKTYFRFKPLEAARKFNSNMLNVEDAWFSHPHYANALAQYMAANSITVEMMETGVGEIQRGPFKGQTFSPEIMDKARKYAVLEAQKATYRDLNDLSAFFMKVGKPKDTDNKVERVMHMLVEGVIPFRKTPANILCRAMEYSPVGFLHGMEKLVFEVPRTYRVQKKVEELQQKRDAGEELTDKEKKFLEKAKKFKPTTVAEALDRLCSGMTGTAIFALGMYLAKLGLLVAKTDNGDDEQKYYTQLLGHQQWAIETPEGAKLDLLFFTLDLDGISFTVDWMAPEVVPLFMGAQFYMGFQAGDPIRNLTNLADSVSMVIDPVMELSCMSGINEALNNFAQFSEGDVNTMVSVGSSLALSYFSQGIPTLFGQLERVSQEQRMKTFTQDDQLIPADWQYQIGKISAKIPGWDYHQIPYVDSWGNTETETKLWKRIVANMFNPAYVKKIDTRPIAKELQRLYDATGDGSVLPDPGWKTYRYTDENGKNQIVYLSEEEYLAYSRAKGRENFDKVNTFINSEAYKKLSDPDRAGIIRDLYDYSEYEAQSNYINNFKGEPKSWITNYKDFSDLVGGYSVSDFVVVRNASKNAKGLKDPNKPNGNSIQNTTSSNKVLAIYDSGVKIPSDPANREAFMEALEVAKTCRGWNRERAQQEIDKAKKKYGIPD